MDKRKELQIINNTVDTLQEPPNPNGAIGKQLIVLDNDNKEVMVTVQSVQGNINEPFLFEINGYYLVSMLDFYTQLLEGRRPDAEELKDWDTLISPLKKETK